MANRDEAAATGRLLDDLEARQDEVLRRLIELESQVRAAVKQHLQPSPAEMARAA